jgi:hypothetical protein
MKLVKVIWNDAFTDLTKHVYSAAEINHEPAVLESVGWLLREDEIGITIAQDKITGEEFTYRNVGFIPRGMIVNIVTLYEKQKRGKGL